MIIDFVMNNWTKILLTVFVFMIWADFSYKLEKIEKNTRAQQVEHETK
tara:strand:- start:15 stop:158 length:144 start_codon:yes stop_codon:yes gene_type:complete